MERAHVKNRTASKTKLLNRFIQLLSLCKDGTIFIKVSVTWIVLIAIDALKTRTVKFAIIFKK